MINDRTMWQLRNVASLPGIVDKAVLMPDAHEGYGFPIGGVAAFDREEGIVSPGGIGYDINCGVRLIKTELSVEDIEGKEKKLAEKLFKAVPTGVGASTPYKLSHDELDTLTEMGVKWALERGLALEEDVKSIEEEGYMENANAKRVSPTAKARGKNQIGTLGAGNHFLEVQVVEEIADDRAKEFNLREGQVVIMVHCGSRGYGHQIATDYIHEFMPIARKKGFFLPDKELVYMPLKEEKAWHYIEAMRCAVNFAFVNRQVIAWHIREVFSKMFNIDMVDMPLLYDVAHNIAKFEEHKTRDGIRNVLVHRKGATRAFPKGREEIPQKYREVGQPVLIPGSMGTASYVLVGEEGSMERSFGSSCHGAGRRMSRRQATHEFKGESLVKQLWSNKHIYVKPKSMRVAAEEAPLAYKDVDEVVRSVELAGISSVVAKLRPLIVVKG
ncbi:MAG: RtcB family protein [Methanobacteriota archaeon]|nr:MAG: RtcB family protein [Euryarchaeota archaeon]